MILQYVNIGVLRICVSIFPGWPYDPNSFPSLEAVMTSF